MKRPHRKIFKTDFQAKVKINGIDQKIMSKQFKLLSKVIISVAVQVDGIAEITNILVKIDQVALQIHFKQQTPRFKSKIIKYNRFLTIIHFKN